MMVGWYGGGICVMCEPVWAPHTATALLCLEQSDLPTLATHAQNPPQLGSQNQHSVSKHSTFTRLALTAGSLTSSHERICQFLKI